MNPPDNSAKPLFAALVGLDWGDRQHALALRPADTSSTETSTLDHSAENVRAWIQQIEQRFGGRPVALALETSKGPLIHLFFDVPWLTVYPIHPATSARIRKAFTPSGAKDDTPDAHPDAGLFRELPGAGPMLAPRLLVAFGTDRGRYESAAAMQRYSGVAPVKEKSGGRVWVHWRWNAPGFLRQTLIEWAGQTVLYCDWARAYYEQQKKRGKHHWAILRSLAFIWVRILWKCWQSRTPYNEATYLAALRRRNSKLIQHA